MKIKQAIITLTLLLSTTASTLAANLTIHHAKHQYTNTPVYSSKPDNWSRHDYLQYLAHQLGWESDPTADNLCKGYYLTPEYIKKHPEVMKSAPLEITATGPETLKAGGISELKDNVVITQPGRIIYADKVFIFRNQKTGKVTRIVLVGHVRIYQKHSLLVSENALLTLHPRTIFINHGLYHYHSKTKGAFNAWGTARDGYQSASKVTTLHNATYSTCNPSSPTWQISASKLVLDKPKNEGRAYNAVLRLGSLPILWLPYYSFQLNNARKTGFLSPIFGHIDGTGYYLGLPYYINLAPNYDLLLTPEYYGQRGFRGLAQFRYLTKASSGDIHVDYLPNDKVFGQFRTDALNTYSNTAIYPRNIYQPYLSQLRTEQNQRYFLSAQDDSEFNPHWYLRYYLNYVSDPYYFNDITANSITLESLTDQLLNLMQTEYTTSNWDFNAYLLHYQTLHIIDQIQGQAQALDQYSRLPAFDSYNYWSLSPNVDLQFGADYSNFTYGTILALKRPTGQRLHIRPGITWSLENSAAFFKPGLWLDAVGYDMNNSNLPPTINSSSSRVLPIFDIDTGLHFVRTFDFKGQSYNQTLEPRLFYLFVPYTNQNNLPNFDTFELPFFFDQLFALNAFQGFDRLENANQLSMMVSSNISSSETGRTILNANFGTIYYMTQPRVCIIPGCQLAQRNFSPLIANLNYYPTVNWTLSGSIAWDPKFRMTNNALASIAYNFGGERIVGLTYEYVGGNGFALPTFTQPINPLAVNFSNNTSYLLFDFAWPITSRWSTLAYTGYNLRLSRLDSLYAGVQYDSCCWSIRFIIRRLFDGSTLSPAGRLQNTYDTGYLVQFTLKGLGGFGSGSDSMIRSLIPGYK